MIIILCIWAIIGGVIDSAPLKIEYTLGYSVSSNPGNFKAVGNNWSWEYWGDGRSFGALSPLAGWGRLRLGANIRAGGEREHFQLRFTPTIVQVTTSKFGVHTPELYYDGEYTVILRTPKFNIGISSWYIGSGPIESSFRDMGDPLGAFKVTNTTMPKLTFRFNTKLNGWNTIGYYIQGNNSRQVPATELIPDSVYTALNIRPGSLNFYNEEPRYHLLRLSKRFLNGWNMGLNLGQKEAYNVPVSRVGYLKKNVGFDLNGRLDFFNRPTFTLAFLDSTGEWRSYGAPTVGVEQGFEKLGEISGKAGKLEVSGLKIGPVSIRGSFHSVDPSFQWIAVRDVRYAHNMWSAIADKDFILRDPKRKNEYMSDVGLYLGQQTLRGEFELPGQIALFNNKSHQAKFNLEVINANKLGTKKIFDLLTYDELEQGYTQFSANLEMKYSTKTDLNFFSWERQYHQTQDFKKDFGIRATNQLSRNLKLEAIMSNTKRMRVEDRGIGSSKSYQLFLKGLTASGIETESSIDYRVGSYNYRLVDGYEDRVLDNNSAFLALSQYVETDRRARLGKMSLSIKLASEATIRKTDIPNLASGLSIVGLAQVGAIYGATTFEVTAIGARGPKSYDFPTGELHNLLDFLGVYRPLASPDTTIKARCTLRNLDEKFISNWHIAWESQVNNHTFKFTYGGAPTPYHRFTDYYNAYFAGTMQDGRAEPSILLKGRPWAYWGTKSIETKTTLINNFSMSWSMKF